MPLPQVRQGRAFELGSGFSYEYAAVAVVCGAGIGATGASNAITAFRKARKLRQSSSSIELSATKGIFQEEEPAAMRQTP